MQVYVFCETCNCETCQIRLLIFDNLVNEKRNKNTF